MKKLANFILTVCVVIGLGSTLWIGVRKQKEKPAAEGAAAAEGAPKEEEVKPEDFVVKLEKEKWQALDIDKAEPEKAELKPQRIGPTTIPTSNF